jgi:hypothetical protein
MWTFHQSTGQLSRDGVHVATGYAGHGAGVDNPAMENVPNIGPLPQGTYTIGPEFTHPHTGPLSMRLEPDASNEMFGRGGFLLHGDNATHTAKRGMHCHASRCAGAGLCKR